MQSNLHLSKGETRLMTLSSKIILAVIVFCLTLGLIILGITTGLHILFSQRILPGVSVSGTQLGGKTLAETEEILERSLIFPQQGRVVLKVEGQSWVVKPADLGMMSNITQTAYDAYQVGRGGSIFGWLFAPIKALVTGYPISPVIVYDEKVAEQYLITLAEQIDRPTLEAHLGINGTTVELVSGQVGRELDIGSALNDLNDELMILHDFSLSLPIIETPPLILDAREQAVIAQQILFAPLTLSMPEGHNDLGPWVISVEDLAEMLVIGREEDTPQTGYQVTLDQEIIRDYLNDLQNHINRICRTPDSSLMMTLAGWIWIILPSSDAGWMLRPVLPVSTRGYWMGSTRSN